MTPTIGISMGDPSGIGPEIVLKSLLDYPQSERIVILGDPSVLEAACARHTPGRRIAVVGDPAAPAADRDAFRVLATSNLEMPPPLGDVSAESGRAAFQAIEAGITHAMAGRIAGLVTAPIHKEALSAAGVPYPGHTEMLADKAGGVQVAMMLANDELRTVLVTIHCALRDAIDRADFAAQMRAIRLAREGGRRLGFANPRVAVAGLNPHAGEGGLFGDEEIRIIAPAIAAAREEGIDVTGPWPGDTVFMQARQGRFDVVVAQYHDQGLIPVKYMGLEKGVNITLGLPFVRTSPDHGTAFDIAGKGVADPASLLTALRYAEAMIDAPAGAAAEAG